MRLPSSSEVRVAPGDFCFKEYCGCLNLASKPPPPMIVCQN
jgi:hypothetical protein